MTKISSLAGLLLCVAAGGANAAAGFSIVDPVGNHEYGEFRLE